MGIYDRDWYRGEQKSPNNGKISRQDAEKLRRMMEGSSPNEPPKVDPKYRFEFADNPTRNDKQSSNVGYDPTYGCGYESSAVKQGSRFRSRGLGMKPLSFIILVAVIGYVIAVGYNVITIHGKANEEFLTKNGLSISMEVGSRIGLAGTLGIVIDIYSNKGNASSIWQDKRILREAVNVLYDWYAPIK
jgi:hypothetical protein